MKYTISTPSRLHLGFFDLSGGGGRSYGGFGVGLEKPRLVLAASKSDSVCVLNDDSGVFEDYLNRILEEFDLSSGVSLDVSEVIPRHVGLGSGTQAALACASVISKLYDLNISPRVAAEKLGRGRVSGIGVGVFEKGGLVADGGHVKGDVSPPPVFFSKTLSGNWAFIVVVPDVGQGLSGEVEKKAMKMVSSTSLVSEELASIFMSRVLPAIEDVDVEAFGSALTDVDVLVGRAFARSQGGVYSKKICADLIDFLLSAGVYGAGQSSWGPTVYGLVDEKNSSVLGEVEEFMQESGVSGRVFLSKVASSGATLK